MPERILIVDDDADSRRFLNLLMQAAGYETLEAEDGEQAVATALDTAPDLVLMDVVMPRLDGYQACERLKAHESVQDVPVVFLSAKRESEDKIRGLEAGGADYVTKPFDQGEVLARVRAQLKLRALTGELRQVNRELTAKQERIDRDLRAAGAIQRSLLPQTGGRSPALPGRGRLDVAWSFRPSELVGGDIFNVLPLTDTHLSAYMLDVSGHGVPSALVAVSASQTLQPYNEFCVRQEPGGGQAIVPPARVLETLDREFPMERFDRHFTIFYMVLDTATGRLDYSAAAHPPPLLLRAGGGRELLERGGTIIGLGGVIPFEEGSLALEPGDRLVLFTDGIVEHQRADGAFFGTERLYAVLDEHRDAPLEAMLEHAVQAMHDFGNGVPPLDDVSLLALEYCGEAEPRVKDK
jgi:sigma-B regulation protein RsbU (phosphoserine phosphatase)